MTVIGNHPNSMGATNAKREVAKVDGRTLEPKQNENFSESKDSLTE